MKKLDDGSFDGFETIEEILREYVPEAKLRHVARVLHGFNQGGPVEGLDGVDAKLREQVDAMDVDLKTANFKAALEQNRRPRIVRVGLIQNHIVLPTTHSFKEQAQAIRERIEDIIDAAGSVGVNVICLQEAWHMPFAFCTRERQWSEFAEPASAAGPTVAFCQAMSRKWGMVIICPILERDLYHGETIWNTAVVIGPQGQILGKHRKNHIPRVGDFNESSYYMEGNTGHPVFETPFGRIGINICYGRHHPLNWQAFGLNGAEIVFNPCATVGELSEPIWGIEARNAAIANNYFVGAVNRVGTETFPNEFTSGDGRPAHKDFGHFFGSSYMSSPDGSRSVSLSRCRDGLLITDCDLNLVRQVRDKWGFQMTARYPMYAELLTRYVQHDFRPQRIGGASSGGVDEEEEVAVVMTTNKGFSGLTITSGKGVTRSLTSS